MNPDIDVLLNTSKAFSLFAEGIQAVVDLYEDEDGDDDYGRTIIRKIWSVRIKNVKK